jgi:hypothetical protein
VVSFCQAQISPEPMTNVATAQRNVINPSISFILGKIL